MYHFFKSSLLTLILYIQRKENVAKCTDYGANQTSHFEAKSFEPLHWMSSSLCSSKLLTPRSLAMPLFLKCTLVTNHQLFLATDTSPASFVSHVSVTWTAGMGETFQLSNILHSFFRTFWGFEPQSSRLPQPALTHHGISPGQYSKCFGLKVSETLSITNWAFA